jgi:hypothetical protein
MSQLTTEERRRTFERRQAAVRGSQRPHAPRAITIEEFAARQRGWPRSARFGALLALVAAGALVLAQTVRVVSLHGAPALIEWLLPRV